MKKYVAALYMRLSKDDGKIESSSISNQRKILKRYAEENCFDIYKEYIDDGYSGTSFDRPAWNKMITDIENGSINTVMVKDLSRIGRDYIISGQYTEIYFPSKGVRLIAVNDGYDSFGGFSDMIPFRNVLNEMYARDISRKIRSSLHSKMLEGSFIGNFAPYGYKKDENNKNHLIIDNASAEIVKRIFEYAYSGLRPTEIAEMLNKENVLTPKEYRKYGFIKGYVKDKLMWRASTVCKIISNEVYIGSVVQGKSKKVSFKSDVMIRNPKNEWIKSENRHEAIIDRETFEKISEARKRK